MAEEIKELTSTTPYMLRNDGALLPCGDAHPYIKMYNNSTYEQNLHELFDLHPNFLEWYKANSKLENIDELIEGLKKEPTSDKLNKLNDLMNQEFCRVRTSNHKYKYGGDNGEIYFRISSTGFNWFDLIWKVVNEFSNQIKKVSVLKDTQTFGTHGFTYYKLKGKDINHMDVEEFITAPGNPIIEQLPEKETEPMEKLQEAQQSAVKSNGVYSALNDKWIKEPVQADIPDLDEEAFDKLFTEWEDKYFDLINKEGITSEDVNDFIEDIYDLRKTSIATEGEYGLGNLTFKEFRNLGYLDNLKELKNELKSKELSLEGLK